ncbi:MAG: glycine betaine/proline transport system ATP-binding protein [Moorella sp. (in: firmicutes)]|jgi:glycine betaine/proline transport system ATP-binding protein|uniref:quaternary amine ABC transporter ATP-binding protein n=1 Tax=unclassified Neomoorella TaxID=2676739 RepID=UPI0010FFC1A1|nr:glycine betaine/proline transport system ATP-binding protein [Moorella sp. (in: firmicutes)]MDK2894935.1 glycine betaine/proline transport system ATP-binding protein [Moorella sp. (in: firmicutes)]GEA13961.1 glycine/betaine ABC transporter ATP-binding protein [Moorella sp. E308F]GEA18666.1 glycine/betaine ABC transporter ATP-binding protein [Moorella sp. E306M]
MTTKVSAQNIYKIFGPNPEKALKLLEQGMSKEDIFRKTGHTVGVNNASFDIEAGEIFVIMGLSGSGKSTLLRCVNRLIEPTRGRMLIDGEDILQMNEDQLRTIRRKKMGMVFQRFALFPHRNIIRNVEYGLEIQGVDPGERRRRSMAALELVGLAGWAESYPHELSGGMQQRVGLARALANDPDILLMDEAFSALDPLIRKEMQDELLDLQAKMKKTILFITHDLDEALKIGDRIAVMKDGVIVQIGRPEEILTNPASDYVAEFVQDVDRSKVLTAGSIMKKPEVMISTKDGPHVALRKMREMGLSSVFVVDKERELRGLVTVDKLIRRENLEKKDLSELIETDIPTTSPETPVRDLFGMAAETKVPIAVVDEKRRLLGIIARVHILAAMAGEEVGS